MSLILVIREGDKIHKIKLCAVSQSLGRSTKCNFTIQDPMVSSKHITAHINSKGVVIIKDLQSTNGTFINNSKILESRLYIGDEVKFGQVSVYLNPTAMTSREKLAHTRDHEMTKVNYISLPESMPDAVDHAMAEVRRRNPDQSQLIEKSEIISFSGF